VRKFFWSRGETYGLGESLTERREKGIPSDYDGKTSEGGFVSAGAGEWSGGQGRGCEPSVFKAEKPQLAKTEARGSRKRRCLQGRAGKRRREREGGF